MPQHATVTVRADTLPPEYAALIRPRPMPSDMVKVTVEVQEPTQEEFIARVRAGIDLGRADVAAGRVVDGKTAMREMHQELFGKEID